MSDSKDNNRDDKKEDLSASGIFGPLKQIPQYSFGLLFAKEKADGRKNRITHEVMEKLVKAIEQDKLQEMDFDKLTSGLRSLYEKNPGLFQEYEFQERIVASGTPLRIDFPNGYFGTDPEKPNKNHCIEAMHITNFLMSAGFSVQVYPEKPVGLKQGLEKMMKNEGLTALGSVEGRKMFNVINDGKPLFSPSDLQMVSKEEATKSLNIKNSKPK